MSESPDGVMPIDAPREWHTCLICGKASYVISYTGHVRMRIGVCGKEECLVERAEQLIAAEERAALYERAIKCLARIVDEKGGDLQKSLAELQLAAEFYGEGKK